MVISLTLQCLVGPREARLTSSVSVVNCGLNGGRTPTIRGTNPAPARATNTDGGMEPASEALPVWSGMFHGELVVLPCFAAGCLYKHPYLLRTSFSLMRLNPLCVLNKVRSASGTNT